ncbi:MAG TPA: isocitrate/isopropylmalate family dehydrogenase [Solirubrobacteraceae bacterium]|jgi:tartrate dehydrogenase/decarboxylase/D-malate dehydrogenase|nr:isocitrate/isopropylmalate family dehydrogenase [Solirubrobacteraceae bacterium]
MRVVLLPGDGVGAEVIAEARRVVDALGCGIEWTEVPWGSAYWGDHGRMMPDDALDLIAGHDAVLMGAIGDPRVPDHETLWGLVLKIRQELDLWSNERPARLLPGIPCPLAGRGPEDVDMLFVRENTEGEYSGVGGRVHAGMAHDVAIDSTVFTRRGCERIVRRAFELAAGRKRVLTSATKSNASRYAFPFWDEIVAEVGADFPQVRVENVLVDALAARMVRDPGSIDVVVASNLFGDILTDIAAALQGGLGMAASANVCPGGDVPGLFEPVHGSAPDIAGQGIANPAGAIWSAALMLDHLGLRAEASCVMAALEEVCLTDVRTRDVGGAATTEGVGMAVAAAVARDRSRGSTPTAR